MIGAILILPAVAGLAMMLTPGRTVRRFVLLLCAFLHLAIVVWLCVSQPQMAPDSWIGLDGPGRLFLAITSVLFLIVSIYAIGYLRMEEGNTIRDSEEGFFFRNEPEGIFVGCFLLFLSTMSLVCVSQHLGLLWVAIEATTLVSAPLIGFHRHHRSLEATWKYLLICSVGIALALLGIFFLTAAGQGHIHHLTLHRLMATAAEMDPVWLKAAFILLLIGYGTKMGLAPMHTWLPDAHSEAPSMVSALLSGALLNCAFLGILRGHAILIAAGIGLFSGQLLITLGLLSMGAAAVFMIRQTDFKRMLAYSSIEHMGIMALGAGIGGLAYTGSLLHAINHSMTKGLLFLVAGNLLTVYRTKSIQEVRGAIKMVPVTGTLWLLGFFAITGAPPFGIFLSKLIILKGAMESGFIMVSVLYLLTLGIIFVAMARLILPMAFGSPDQIESEHDRAGKIHEPVWSLFPPLVLGAIVILLGVVVPQPLWNTLCQVTTEIGAH